METLSHYIIDMLPLDHTDLRTLNQVSRAMRDSVAAVRCMRGVRVHQRDASCVLHNHRYTDLTKLEIFGDTRDPPVPVPRRLPRLTTLVMRNCWMPEDPEYWATVFCNAPRLTSLKLFPPFHRDNYANDLLTIARVASLGAGQLTNLHFQGALGKTLRYWAPGCMVPQEQAVIPALVTLMTTPPISMPGLRTLVIRGRQAFLAVDAPLVEAIIEEPADAAKGWCTLPKLLGSAAQATLDRLFWRVPAGMRVSLAAFHNLRTLDLVVNGIQTARELQMELESLRSLPDGITHLHLHFEFWGMAREARPAYTNDALSCLRNLEQLRIIVSFATLGCGCLVRDLLGVPPCAPLNRIVLTAYEGAAQQFEREYEDLLRYEDADPYDDDMRALRQTIQDIRLQSCVATSDVHRVLDTYPRAKISIDGFEDPQLVMLRLTFQPE